MYSKCLPCRAAFGIFRLPPHLLWLWYGTPSRIVRAFTICDLIISCTHQLSNLHISFIYFKMADLDRADSVVAPEVPKTCKAGVVVNPGPDFKLVVEDVPVPEPGKIACRHGVGSPYQLHELIRTRTGRDSSSIECDWTMLLRHPLHAGRSAHASHERIWHPLPRS